MQIIKCEKTKEKNYQNDVCDRHIRLFGESLQDNLSTMTIGIVGAGGLGAILVEQIMRLYPHKIIIIDKDFVELSNLNRLTNAYLSDVSNRTSKVEVVKRAVLSNNPKQDITVINGDFLVKENQEVFKECDFIFGALDSIGVRFAINQLAVAHGIPYLDCGTGVIIEDKKIKHVGGQVISIMPDSGICLYCADLFDKKEAMKELIDADELSRQEDMGYIKGADIVAPQVYALNMLVASTAVWLFMKIVSGENFSFHGIAIDAKIFSLSPWINNEHDNIDCPICGKNGIAFLGDEAELLCRDNTETIVTPKLVSDVNINLHDENVLVESTNKIQVITTKWELPEYPYSYPKLIIGDDKNFLNFNDIFELM